MRAFDQQAQDKRLKAYKVTFPRDLDVERVKAWLHTVSGTLQPRFKWLPRAMQSTPTMVFETWSQSSGISWRLLVPWEYASITTQLSNAVPGISVTPDDQYPRRRWSRVIEVGVKGSGRQFNLGNPSDVSTAILSAMTAVQGEEALVMQWVVTPAPRQHLPIQGEARSDQLSLRGLAKGTHLANPDEVSTRREKLKEPNYQAVLRVASYANTKARANELLSGVRTALVSREAAGITFTKRYASSRELQLRVDNAAAPQLAFPAQLSITELSSFIGWRLANVDVPGLPAFVARQIVPTDVVPRIGRPLGMSNYPGRERPVAVAFDDLLTHCWIVGRTGAGKTTLLGNGMKADMEAGHGIFMIETKSDLFKAVLDYIPPGREKDVYILDLSNAHRSVGLNLLDQDRPDRTIDTLTMMFEDMYASGRGVWSRAVFYNGLKVLVDNEGCGILDLNPLLNPQTDADLAWREQAIANCRDEEVRAWWADHDSKPEAKRQQVIAPVLDRIWQFGKPKLRAVLGQSKSAFKFSEAVKNNRIVLVNLAGVEPTTAELLGSIIFDQYKAAVMDDANRPAKPNFGYFDEFHRITHLQKDFADTLATSRSKLFGLTMAHQYRDQLPTHLLEAVVRNTGTQVVFKADGSEGAAFAAEFGSMTTKDDFGSLPPRTAIARVATNGGSSPPFTLTTNPPAQGYGNGARIKGNVLAALGMDAADVEAQIKARRNVATGKGSQRFSLSDSW